MGLEQRSAQRRKKMVVHRAADHEDAEQWDLEHWQQKTPQERLAALATMQEDAEKIRRRR